VSGLFDSPEECISAAVALAETIAGYSPVAVSAAKQAVNAAYEEGLSLGLKSERRLFWGSFATQDRKIGMEAFVKKEKPVWSGK
jgi:enoyl-CoA hydratase/carnithine racemase